jgi:hypothetical protein
MVIVRHIGAGFSYRQKGPPPALAIKSPCHARPVGRML